MDKMRIRGGKPLQGVVQVSGSKNAALPILISVAPDRGQVHLSPRTQPSRYPNCSQAARAHGRRRDDRIGRNEVTVSAANITQTEAPYDLVRTMRASVLVLGPLLARFGKAKVSLPGGCAIGARPINFHLAGLEKLGAEIDLQGGYVIARAKKLRGARVAFEFPSVGATEHLMMAASLAKGESVLKNCAREPEIVDLARALRAMGAELEGEGTEVIRIQGKTELHGCDYEVMGDRIEAGTFLAAGFATRGSVRVEGLEPEFLEAVLVKFEDAGAKVTREPGFIEDPAQEAALAARISPRCLIPVFRPICRRSSWR